MASNILLCLILIPEYVSIPNLRLIESNSTEIILEMTAINFLLYCVLSEG